MTECGDEEQGRGECASRLQGRTPLPLQTGAHLWRLLIGKNPETSMYLLLIISICFNKSERLCCSKIECEGFLFWRVELGNGLGLDPQILWEMPATGCIGVERVKMTLDVELHQQLADFYSLIPGWCWKDCQNLAFSNWLIDPRIFGVYTINMFKWSRRPHSADTVGHIRGGIVQDTISTIT